MNAVPDAPGGTAAGAWDVIVIGCGPAGMAAASEAASRGLRTLLLDEQAQTGGQIYRAVEIVAAARPADIALLGPDYQAGRALTEAFRRSGAVHRAGATVWRVDAAPAVSGGEQTGVEPSKDTVSVTFSVAGEASVIAARRLIIAIGAYERPVPVPGWTLPGCMTVGGAQTMLKAAGMAPTGRVVLAGSGPLVLLAATQLKEAGAEIVAVLETRTWRDYCRAAPLWRCALRGAPMLRKGLGLRRKLGKLGIPYRDGVRSLAVEGADRAAGVRYETRQGRRGIACDAVLLHEGVIPHVQITRQIGAAHDWYEPQRYWRPRLDAWGRTSVPGVSVAGDCGGIDGADAAETTGRLAGLDAAHALGAIGQGERDTLARPWRRKRDQSRAIRPFLDALYAPPAWVLNPPDDAAVVCRCEEITAGAVRQATTLGAQGPNQLKTFTRAGMGPCQGRLCGPTVSEVMAGARGVPVADIGVYRVRPPIKPVTVGELASLATD